MLPMVTKTLAMVVVMTTISYDDYYRPRSNKRNTVAVESKYIDTTHPVIHVV
jgi:hypothetical protein